VGRGPRAPRLGRVVDAEAASEAGVRAGQGLAPEIALQAGVVSDARAVAATDMREGGAAAGDVVRPIRRTVGTDRSQEFVSGAFTDAILGHTCEDHAVGGLVGAVVVVRVDVDEGVARPGVVAAEVQEGRTAEAGR